MTDNLVVMLTAFNLEYEAVRRKLTGRRIELHERGTRFEVGTLEGTTCEVALVLTGKGNSPAATLVERAVQQFSPVAVMFVGVAGALWGTPLGDVVVATHVYAYHGGTSDDDGLKARPRVWETSHEIAQLAAHLAREGEWNERPKVHFGAVAAGEIVQNSRTSAEAAWIRAHYNDAVAIEMEAAGVAQAGHLSGAPVAIIRGISDHADGTKATDEDRKWQPVAAENAARFAAQLAEHLVAQRTERTVAERTAGPRISNVAHGPVGIQGSTVTGSTVTMNVGTGTPASVDLAAELRTFRGLLACERAAGNLDELTYEAARAELDLADRSAGGREAVLPLKRLRGLIAELPELAATLAAVITAAVGS
ncbi:purine phosphorylase [Lentzea aerocolonigenes]|uniref:Purine phosphorylase n=1 Tax=Lentzea aerocolonigenes TaxID=68170 RepID=A0A0F0GLH7_LENAE|nr:5'-methylthioadenosine/S-adenosylhomocysteine nucleosidase [Lentzea aerocolonigenes]KJK42827.1 purine phosphorylase [Lentzea aerocolonigenes]